MDQLNCSFNSLSITPVKVTVSPAISQKGELRGVPRTIRDAAANLSNSIQEWNRLNLEGLVIVQTIASKKCEQLLAGNIYPAGLEKDCDLLKVICSEMKSIVEKMEQIHKNFIAINKMEEKRSEKPRPIFLTWEAEHYVSIVEKIFKEYSQELKLKYDIKENIAHVTNKDNLALYECSWEYQPYIDNNRTIDLECMLLETGLKVMGSRSPPSIN